MQLEKIMKTSFELIAEFRETQGKGASRRLRHDGKVPAILYGGHTAARNLTLSHQKLMIMLENERFYSTILNLKVGDQTQEAILKDAQRFPRASNPRAAAFRTCATKRKCPACRRICLNSSRSIFPHCRSMRASIF